MKITIEGEHEVQKMGCYCYVCGRNLGTVIYLKDLSDWNHLDHIPVCNDCFSKYGLPKVSMDKIQHPFQRTRST